MSLKWILSLQDKICARHQVLSPMHHFRGSIGLERDIWVLKTFSSIQSKKNRAFFNDYKFYRENGIDGVGLTDCQHLIKFFDSTMEGRLHYTDYLQLVLPCEQ